MKISRGFGETLTLATTVGFATVKGRPEGANAVMIEVPSATLENISVALEPVVQLAYVYDSAAATYTDVTRALRNRVDADVATLNDFLLTDDFFYIGCEETFRGLAVNVGNTNSTASVATWEYWNGSAWTDISDTDGTASGGATLGVDGLVTWTTPSDWARVAVNSSKALFWVRMKVSATLDASVTVIGVVPLIVTVASESGYMLLRSNNDSRDAYVLHFDPNAVGGIEMKSTSITSACNINWIRT